MRALLHAWHEWASKDAPPPPNQYPRLSDGTLVRIDEVKFPMLKGVADPRRIVGPARRIDDKIVPLPHLVPQVDRDGNDLAGHHDPEIAVPLATATGWNFRDPSVGNPQTSILGSYILFTPTKAARQATGDPRLSLEERYRGVDDFLQRIRSSALLAEYARMDQAPVVPHAYVVAFVRDRKLHGCRVQLVFHH